MRIYSMTATFGKLEHATLVLEPGLTVLEAPNEWGKSTWCAFLLAMFYGMDTRARSTKTVLADKERYAPWSGSAMSGRIDLCWEGRDITIERSSKGKGVFNQFRAYETASGMPVAELDGTNCGAVLLGVEQSVFLRSGFLRLADLPVTQDEALRRRLNALVTTGDESDTADTLGKTLRELKNRCRFNRTGLLPQAEQQREQVLGKLDAMEQLQQQRQSVQLRLEEIEKRLGVLENHRQALAYESAKRNAEKLSDAVQGQAAAEEALQELRSRWNSYAEPELAQTKIESLQRLQTELADLQQKQPQPPEDPLFQGKSPEEAWQQTQEAVVGWRGKPAVEKGLLIAGILLLLGAVALLLLKMAAGWVLLALGLTAVGCWGIRKKNIRAVRQSLALRFGSPQPEQWLSRARDYGQRQQDYRKADTQWRDRYTQLKGRLEALTGEHTPAQCLLNWQEMTETGQALRMAQAEWERATEYRQAMETVLQPVEPPANPDSLTDSFVETVRQMQELTQQRSQLQMLLGSYGGQIAQLGDAEPLAQELERLNTRIERLETAYGALTLAQQALSEAGDQLQRRFAPRIAGQAGTFFGRLTGNRYDRMTWDEAFQVKVGADNEDVLRGIQWRSDGTVDQLYLALRLAVSRELLPQAPLILDDALVRFDDARLAAALEILQQEARYKQVIVFTCQSREKYLLEAMIAKKGDL